MKKLLVLFLTVSVIMVLSLAVLADVPPDYDLPDEWCVEPPDGWSAWEAGVGIFENYEESKFAGFFEYARNEDTDEYVVVEGVTVTGVIDDLWGVQRGIIYVPARLYIPCYLEMHLVGNGGKTKVKTLGIDEDPYENAIRHGSDNVIMLFHPGLTGVVDSKWNFVNAVDGQRLFSSIGPGSDADPDNAKVFIHACDIFRLDFYGNIAHNISVKAEPFTHYRGMPGTEGDDTVVYLQMRYNLNSMDDGTWSETKTVKPNNFSPEGGFEPCSPNTMFFQFRVPWVHMEAGEYRTIVTFSIFNI